jgi:glyceraldehyde 3-phosphate dehydrogenase
MALADTARLQQLIGQEALAALIASCGGLAVHIPKRPPLAGALCDLPEPAQQALTHAFGGTVLYIPKCDGATRAARDAAIVAAYDAGVSVQELARRYRLTERWVYEIIGRPAEARAAELEATMVRVAINGFGRVGRCAARAAFLDKNPGAEIVAVNDLTDDKTLAHLLKYDSVHRRFPGTVEARDGKLVINGKEVVSLAESDPKKLPWKDLKVDVVLECTGKFTNREQCALHLESGAKKVVLSAPAKGSVDATLCIGINTETYDPRSHHVISNASCTTNCLAPMAKVLHDNWGIEAGLMTTIHSYTMDQRLLDYPHKDLRRARAAAVSMIPTTTGAAKAIGLVLPALAGKLHGMAIRVPTPNVSLVDLTVNLARPASKEAINQAYKKAAEGPFKQIMLATEEPLVSIDYLSETHSCCMDLDSTMLMGDRLVKVLAWYDNEMGYSARLWDMCKFVAQRI